MSVSSNITDTRGSGTSPPPVYSVGNPSGPNPTTTTTTTTTATEERRIRRKRSLTFVHSSSACPPTPASSTGVQWSTFEHPQIVRSNDALVLYTINIQSSAFSAQDVGSMRQEQGLGIWNAVDTLVGNLPANVLTAAVDEDEEGQGERADRRDWGCVGVVEVAGGVKKLKTMLRNHAESDPRPALIRTDACKFLESISRKPQLSAFLDDDGNKAAIFFTGTFGPQKGDELQQSALMVRIPFSCAPMPPAPIAEEVAQEDAETEGLHSFTNDGAGTDDELPPVDGRYKVHQAVFLALNEDVIITARSKEYLATTTTLLPLPGQPRGGLFHLLVHMIADAIRTSDARITSDLVRALREIERATVFPPAEPPALDKDPRRHYTFAYTLRRLTLSQLSVLTDLDATFSRAVWQKDPSGLPIGNLYTRNMLCTPVISGRLHPVNEQMLYVRASLQDMMTERREMVEQCEAVISGIRNLSQTSTLPSAVGTQTSALQSSLAAQAAQTEQLTDELLWQGKTLSLFTIINVIFLPLGFFTQYFTAPRNGAITTITRFWLVTGLLTLVIAVVASWCVFKSQYEGRKMLRAVTDFLRGRGWCWPLNKPDSGVQRGWVRRLPRYRVQIVAAADEDQHGVGVEMSVGVVGTRWIKLAQAPSESDTTSSTSHDRKSSYPEECKEPLTHSKKMASAAGSLSITADSHRAGVFAFDRERGLLLHTDVDRYDCTYHVHGPRAVAASGEQLTWRRDRMVVEKLPFLFWGRFETQGPEQEELWWRWAEGKVEKRRMKPKWDVQGSEVQVAGFRIKDGKVFVDVGEREGETETQREQVLGTKVKLRLVKVEKTEVETEMGEV